MNERGHKVNLFRADPETGETFHYGRAKLLEILRIDPETKVETWEVSRFGLDTLDDGPNTFVYDIHPLASKEYDGAVAIRDVYPLPGLQRERRRPFYSDEPRADPAPDPASLDPRVTPGPPSQLRVRPRRSAIALNDPAPDPASLDPQWAVRPTASDPFPNPTIARVDMDESLDVRADRMAEQFRRQISASARQAIYAISTPAERERADLTF